MSQTPNIPQLLLCGRLLHTYKNSSRLEKKLNDLLYAAASNQSLSACIYDMFFSEYPTASFDDFKLFYEAAAIIRSNMSTPRLTKYEHAIVSAWAASLRSEDPKRKVGAVACTKSGRIIASSYNGLPPGISRENSWWEEDENRRTYVIHAEINLMSLTRREDVTSVAVTTCPCGPCALALLAHGVQEVVFSEFYPTCTKGWSILKQFNVKTVIIPVQSVLSFARIAGITA